MKLIFTKDPNNEINVELQNGTIIEEFSYTEMIRQLLIKNSFDDCDFVNLSDEEEIKIKGMLQKISEVFEAVEE